MSEGRIATLMRTEILRLSPETPIREATAQLVAEACGAAPVVDAAGQLVGILSQKDCFKPALKASYYQQWEGTVADRMSREVATLDASDDFVSAAETFIATPFRSFPVTSGGELVGMLDRADLLAAFLKHG
jgi:CBS-domain-containing membrane protein